jgi:hypothetical protein
MKEKSSITLRTTRTLIGYEHNMQVRNFEIYENDDLRNFLIGYNIRKLERERNRIGLITRVKISVE